MDEKKACGLHCTKINNISVKFGNDVILKNVSIHIHCGELTVIIGRNGAGKSTLLKAILGEVEHKGNIIFTDEKDNLTKKIKIGYVPQKLNIEKHMPATVFDMFASCISYIPVFMKKDKKIYKEIKEHLKIFGVDRLIDKSIGDLSGGELQRVLIAMATKPIPNLLILDEPVSGIDKNGIRDFYQILNRLKAEYDMSIILVSHDLELANQYADRVILLDKEVIKEGTPQEVFESLEFKNRFGETLIPFEFINYTFMKNALIAIILVSPVFAILGTMIVNNKMAFFSDALGHSAICGIAIGTLLGISNVNISVIFFAVIFALLLNWVKNKTTYGADTIISVFSSIAIALGLAILAQSGSFNKYSSYLVGDILSITNVEIVYLFLTFISVLCFWYFTFNKLNVISINTSLAKSRGINIKLIDNIFVVLIAIIVMISIRWIGILLINSLLILPAASSRNIAKNMRTYHLFSIIISLFSGVLGLILSYYYNIPTGPMIVIISGAIYFVTFAIKRNR